MNATTFRNLCIRLREEMKEQDEKIQWLIEVAPDGSLDWSDDPESGGEPSDLLTVAEAARRVRDEAPAVVQVGRFGHKYSYGGEGYIDSLQIDLTTGRKL